MIFGRVDVWIILSIDRRKVHKIAQKIYEDRAYEEYGSNYQKEVRENSDFQVRIRRFSWKVKKKIDFDDYTGDISEIVSDLSYVIYFLRYKMVKSTRILVDYDKRFLIFIIVLE